MRHPALPLSRPVGQSAVIAVFAALSLGTNYVLIGFANVKLMDSLVFLASFLFGLRVGIGVAISTWTVYGFVNPNGQDDLILLSFLMVGECFYALSAAILQRTSFPRRVLDRKKVSVVETAKSSFWSKTRSKQRLNRLKLFLTRNGQFSFLLGVTGVLTTFAYDVLTNFASWVFRTPSLYQALIVGNIIGAPYSLVHEASNLVFFATVVPSAIISVKWYTGNIRTGIGTT